MFMQAVVFIDDVLTVYTSSTMITTFVAGIAATVVVVIDTLLRRKTNIHTKQTHTVYE